MLLVKTSWKSIWKIIVLFDFQVKDIYGGDCTSLGLPGDLIASSFGKAAQAAPETIQGVWKNNNNDFHQIVTINLDNSVTAIWL